MTALSVQRQSGLFQPIAVNSSDSKRMAVIKCQHHVKAWEYDEECSDFQVTMTI